jgi:predicted transcriptional regulator
MRTVTLSVDTQDEFSRRVVAAFNGIPQGERISFASASLLWQTLTQERWAILEAMTSRQALTLESVAQRVGRDADSVGQDLLSLADAGLIEAVGEDRFCFPYDRVHVDFTLTKAA